MLLIKTICFSPRFFGGWGGKRLYAQVASYNVCYFLATETQIARQPNAWHRSKILTFCTN